MRLLQITDCHLFADPQQVGPGNINPFQSLQKILSLALSLAPDGVLFTGDLSGDGSEQSYQHFAALAESWLREIPWYTIPGNHDLNPFYDEILHRKNLAVGSSWKFNGWLVHGLDTRWQGTRGRVCTHALNRIGDSIAANPNDGHILALHHHPLPSLSWMDRHDLENAEVLLNWLQSHTNLPLVVHGHVHAEMELHFGHSAILGAPASAWQWQLSEDFGVDPQAPGLRIIDLEHPNQWCSSIRRIA
ncbi:hypothetical protein DXV75_03130 [Alteromonas aestuariivivens]|uniref:Calcineurin-like phosphoesterase domain-containing protein n=1 Tax=Alteromonas aestuariivivens TaxID=1938339 RepID=A0A3D8MBX3_9ALTE|nr:metallophosphoesterase [Alteromonas aestuariivivens]RDV27976.1 hypothetical protein DXV75_03130 [Alteromonas aestuariivivens]